MSNTVNENKNLLHNMIINSKKISNKTLFWGISFLLLVIISIMSRDAGISGDEYFHVDHAEKVYNYYFSGGTDTLALNDSKGLLHLYGQSLDNEIHFLNEWFNIDDIYGSRHFFNSLTGWILILFSGLIANLIFGWRAGIIAMLFVFFSPKILGHSFNNPKDLPFASAYIFTLYFILKFIKEIPRNNWITMLFVGLGIGWAISLRIGGVILIPYLFMFIGIYYLSEKRFYSKSGFFEALKKVGIVLLVVIAGYFIGLLLWPYALQNPIKNPWYALKEMTNYDMGIYQLFEGKIQLSKELPWYYGLKYILITNPIVVFLGLILFIATVPFRQDSKNNYLYYSFLFFAFAFPIAYIIYNDSNIYGGWRHLLWTYGPLVILSAGGFDYFLNKNNKYIKYGTMALMAILLFHPVKHTIKNHPLEYVYYNELVGGTKGAYGNYEMDYYYHSLRDGAEWLIENELGNDTIIVATNHGRITEYFFRNYPQVKVIYSRYYEKGKENWDYAIWANTHITPYQLENNYWPPKESIHTMDVDGIPVGAVIKRVSHEDFKGFEASNQGKRNEAKQHFKNFLKSYPENEEVLEGYARIMLQERQLDSTIIYADSSLIYNPNQIGAWFLKASALNTQKKYTEALAACEEMLKIKEEFADGHFQKGFALKNLNKPNEALKALQKATAYKKDYYQALMQMGEILTNYKNYKKALELYSKVLAFKENDLSATIYSAKCYHLQKDNIKAEELLKSIPARNQNNLEAVMVNFRIAMTKNDLNSAGTYLNMARFIDNNAELFVLRAMYVLKQNSAELAIQYLEKAKELDPVNREAQELLASLQKKKTATASTGTAQKTAVQKPKQQQSIMFQKPKPKKTSPITIPAK